MSKFEDKNRLLSKARDLGIYDVYEITCKLLADTRFSEWSGSSKKGQHHYGRGGLLRHTVEVVDLVFMVKNYFRYTINEKELFLAALFHDAGKMYDYEPIEGSGHNEWTSAEHKRNIHHISRSGIIWSEYCKKHDPDYPLHDNVLHAILSHHMTRMSGSPVAPKSRVAWLVCLCDNLSARMYDADTWDILNAMRNG